MVNTTDMNQPDYDVIILGGGAAGLGAALYTCRAMLKTMVIEQQPMAGGQILVTDMIENYPGFPDGIRGPELSHLMETQTKKFGAEIRNEEITGLSNLEHAGKTVCTSVGSYTTKTLIVATGGSHNKLGVPGEDEYAGKGVSYCAVCDGNFFRGEDVSVIGGGDAALDEGEYLTGMARSVTIIHRRDQLRASPILQKRAFSNDKVKFLWSHTVEEIRGADVVQAVRVRNLTNDQVYDYPTSAAFIYIGFHSNNEYLGGQIPIDENGHIQVDINMATSLPGVYAAGDIRVNSYRQLGSAVGDGITAALAAYHYITET